MSVDSNGFYERVPVFDRFSEIADPARYQSLPDDWHLGLADVVQSTKAIRENRYKAVNMAGASVIAAVANALGNRDFPFVFGGDGASFAVRDELNLNLWVALIPVADVRQHGLAVDIARFAPTPDVSYAMFSGGGIAWAEAAMKRGAYAIAPGPPGARPDLSGLSCRFSEIPAVRGTIMSLLVVPAVSPDATYRDFIARLVELIENSPDVSRPVPDGAGDLRWPPEGLELEVRATRRAGGSLLLRRAAVLIATAISYCVLRFNIKVGSFVPTTYLRQLRDNSDFRKYDDALRMVLDCTPALARAIEARLAAAASAGIVRYGIHQQDRAMMTCFTPSAFRSDHVHFIDGALGGYALAASALKGEHATATAHSG